MKPWLESSLKNNSLVKLFNYLESGTHYKCYIEARNTNAKGFGRNEEEALHNASKNLFSDLINKNIDVEHIK